MEVAPFPFIVGRGRSGTTLLRAMLDSHPLVAIPGESNFVVNFAASRRRYEREDRFQMERFLHDLLGHFGFARMGVSADSVTDSFRSSPPSDLPTAIRRVFEISARDRGKSRYGDKTPNYVMHMRLLTGLFPEARFVHIIRDGRDVALSYLEGGWGPKGVAGNALYWRRFVSHGREEGRRLGSERYCEVRYEDLLSDPEGQVRRVCGFIDLEFDPVMLRYFERPDILGLMPWGRQSHARLTLPPTKGLRDWRREMSAGDVALFETLAGDLLDDLGYERTTTAAPPMALRLQAGRQWTRFQARYATQRFKKQVRRRTNRPWPAG